MKKYSKHIITVLICFVLILVLNFALPRLLPGDPVAYLTGFEEEGMSSEKYAYYYHALHLDENIFVQFGYYLHSIFDGSLGYSFKKESTVSSLIGDRIGLSLLITIPAAIISIVVGLIWGMECGYKKNGKLDKISTTLLIALNTIPSFVIAILLVATFAFKWPIFPYMGLSDSSLTPGTVEYFFDRIHHLILPVLTVVLASLPARFLLVRNITAKFKDDKSVTFAEQRGLSSNKIKFGYMFKNIASPFIAMVGVAIGSCFGGSIIVENIFSINGVGGLLNEAIYTLDYPLMQGILFLTTSIMVVCILISDIICMIIDPRIRKEKSL